MFERLYTTKMSANKKSLQKRFSKIRSKNGRISKLMALIIFAVILLAMACVSIIIAANIKSDEYTMTENEFFDYINRPIGAVTADIYYADDSKFVFHYNEGFFIIHKQTPLPDVRLSSELDLAINLKKLVIAYNQQGSSVLDVKISKDGQYAYLSSIGPADEIKDYKNYIVSLDTGWVKKGSMPKNTELFTGIGDTFEKVQNPVGLYSNNCIINGQKTYYLTSKSANVSDIQLVTINNTDNSEELKYVFSKDFVSISQQKSDLIHETLSDDEEILINSGLSWEVNADVVKSVFDKLSETRQMPHIDIKNESYDVIIYEIWKNNESTPRLFVIDNHNIELLFSMSLNKDEYSEINKLVYEPKEQNIKIYTPADIKDIADVELVSGGIKYPLRDKSRLSEIERKFSTAEMIKGGTGCPFTAELIFTKNNGEKGCVTIATDSCAVLKSGDKYYDYDDGDNSDLLLNCFVVSNEELIDLAGSRKYMSTPDIAVKSFFEAFDKSDLDTMKKLVTNEFISKGYFGSHNMCYGLTRATLETCSKANVDEFLKMYLSEPEHARITLSENDIELLKEKSDELAVYSVVVMAEHNIKGKIQPPFKRFLNVICKKQNNNGYLVHKLY